MQEKIFDPDSQLLHIFKYLNYYAIQIQQEMMIYKLYHIKYLCLKIQNNEFL